MYGTRAHATAEMVANSPIFPPSFDNSPLLFGLALFSRLLIVVLASATVVRIVSRTRLERLPCDHPVYYQRMMIGCLLMASILGSGSDVITWLSWGELTDLGMGRMFLVTKTMDALTSVPFIMALFVPYWIKFLRGRGWIQGHGIFELNTALADIRVTWGQIGVPLSLAAWSAAGAAGVAFSKWYLWYAFHAV